MKIVELAIAIFKQKWIARAYHFKSPFLISKKKLSEGVLEKALIFKFILCCVTLVQAQSPSSNDSRNNFKEVYKLPVKVNGKWGMTDTQGNMIISPIFDFIGSFTGQSVAIVQVNQKLGVIDKKGNIILTPKYNNIRLLTDSIWAVLDKKWLIINPRGKQIASDTYDEIQIIKGDQRINEFPKGFLLRQGNKFGLMSSSGKILSAMDADSINYIKYDWVKKYKQDKCGLINLNSHAVIPPEYTDFAIYDSEGLVLLRQGKKIGWADNSGKVVIPPVYDQVNWNTKNERKVVEVSIDGKLGLFDKKFQAILAPEFDKIEALENGHYLVWKQGKVGVYSRQGSMLLDCEFENISGDLGGAFIIEKAGKIGVYDSESEKITIPVEFDSIQFLKNTNQGKNSILIARKANLWCALNKNGKVILRDGEYDEIQFQSPGVFLLRKANKWGISSHLGSISPQFDVISEFKNNLALTVNNGLYGLINVYGQILASAKYPTIKMVGNTARLTDAAQQTEYISLNPDGTVIERYFIGKLKSLKINKIKKTDQQENEEKEAWDFNFSKPKANTDASPRQANNSSSLVQIANQNTSITRDSSDIKAGNFTWFYSKGKWGLKNSRDSIVVKPQFDLVAWDIISQLSLIYQYKVIRRIIGQDTLIEYDVSQGIYNQDTQKFIMTPRKTPDLLDILNDLSKGNIARLSQIYLSRLNKHISKIYIGDEDKEGQFIFYTCPFDSNNLSKFNVGGSPIDSKIRVITRERDIKGGKWGMVNRQGEIKLQPEYDQIESYGRQFYRVKKGKFFGILDSLGNVIIPTLYANIDYLPNSNDQFFLLTRHKTKYGVIDSTAQICIDLKYDWVGKFCDGFAQVRFDSTIISKQKLGNRQEKIAFWTYIDTQGRQIHAPVFQELRDFSEGMAAVRVRKLWGYINTSGQWLIEPQFTEVGNFHEGIAWVKAHKGQGYFYIDTQGNRLHPQTYAKAGNYRFGLAIVKDQEKHLLGLIDLDGNWIAKPKYYYIDEFDEEGFAKFKLSNEARFGLLNKKGKEILSAEYQEIDGFIDGRAIVKKNNKFNYIDTLGRHISKQWFDRVLIFNEGYAAAKYNNQWGYINQNCTWVIPPKYSSASGFYQSIARVSKKGEYQFIDTLGQKLSVMPDTLKWLNISDVESLKPFSENLAAFKKNGLWGYINSDNQVVINARYQKASPFYNGYAQVKIRNHQLYLDKKGRLFKQIPNLIYWMDLEKPRYKIIRIDYFYGFVNPHDFQISSPKYQFIGEMSENYTSVAISHFVGVADLKGNIVLNPDFEVIKLEIDGIFRIEQNDKIGYWHPEKAWIWQLQR
jgi:WG containing repeat